MGFESVHELGHLYSPIWRPKTPSLNPICIQIRRRFVNNLVPLPVAGKKQKAISFSLPLCYPFIQYNFIRRERQRRSIKNGSHGCTSELHDLSFPLLQFLLGPTPPSSYSLPCSGTLSCKSSKPSFFLNFLVLFSF
jgi:hypothetical protein